MTPKKQIPANFLAGKLCYANANANASASANAYAYANASAYASAYANAGVYKGLFCQDLVFVKFELIPAMKETLYG